MKEERKKIEGKKGGECKKWTKGRKFKKYEKIKKNVEEESKNEMRKV
jgi:hypothetical protein